jgi:hypothetical protein
LLPVIEQVQQIAVARENALKRFGVLRCISYLSVMKNRLLLSLLFVTVMAASAWAQDVIRLSDNGRSKTYTIREGDYVSFFALTDSTTHSGDITYIGEKGMQVDGYTYTLDQVRIEKFNSKRRERNAEIAGFAGEIFMSCGQVVCRVGIEVCTWDEKVGWTIGLPTMGVGAGLWLTGAVLNGIVSPVLIANSDARISSDYTAVITDKPYQSGKRND